MRGRRILVVDDDPTVRDVVTRYLEQAGATVTVAGDGPTAVDLARKSDPELVVLDLMLPGFDGLEVFRRLRRTSQVPVVMLTALGEENDRVVGLSVGADDYVTKPFSPRELVLRVDSVLRRAQGQTPGTPRELDDAELHLDLVAHAVTRHGVPLALTSREYDLLVFFLTHPRQAYSRAELLEHVWGWHYADHSTVTVHVRRLREKIERDPTAPGRVVTVFGVGYRYQPVDG